MSTNYYVHNLETDKINIFTGRENWKQLSEPLRTQISRYCLFSRSQGCWISKAKGGIWWKQQLVDAGFEDRGKVGDELSFAEQIEAQQERAENRAERYEVKAERAATESQAAFDRSHQMMAAIPMGQPILVGHHSEGRDRRYRDRAWNLMGKAVETSKKAEHYESRAETAKQTAEAAELSNPAFLGRRIKEHETELRRLELRKAKRPEYTAHYDPYIAKEREKLEFYQGKLAETGVTLHSRDSLKGKKEVKIRGRWEPIVKLNPKTVAVPGCGYTAEIARKNAFKYDYSQVQDAR